MREPTRRWVMCAACALSIAMQTGCETRETAGTTSKTSTEEKKDVQPDQLLFVPGKTTKEEMIEVLGKPDKAEERQDGGAKADAGDTDNKVEGLTWNTPDELEPATTALFVFNDGILFFGRVQFEGATMERARSTVGRLVGKPDVEGFLMESSRSASPKHLMWFADERRAGMAGEEIGADKAGERTVFKMKTEGVGVQYFGPGMPEKDGLSWETVLAEYKMKVERSKLLASPVQKRFYGRPFELGQFRYDFAVPSVVEELGNQLSKAKAGKGAVYVVVRYTIENAGKATATGLAGDLTLVDSLGRTFQPSSEATTALAMSEDVDLALSQLQPGIPRDQAAVFEVPKGVVEKPFEVVIPEKGMLGNEEVRMKTVLSDLVGKAMKK